MLLKGCANTYIRSASAVYKFAVHLADVSAQTYLMYLFANWRRYETITSYRKLQWIHPGFSSIPGVYLSSDMIKVYTDAGCNVYNTQLHREYCRTDAQYLQHRGVRILECRST